MGANRYGCPCCATTFFNPTEQAAHVKRHGLVTDPELSEKFPGYCAVLDPYGRLYLTRPESWLMSVVGKAANRA